MKILNYNQNFTLNKSKISPLKTNNSLNFSPVYDVFQNGQNFLNSYPSSYYLSDLSFMARVDKGLERFYSVNKDIMPETVKNYINFMPQSQLKEITPIEAQQKAFEELIIAENVDDVKTLFPDEPLFEKLKPVSESKATVGILYDMKIMQNDLEDEGCGILKNGEDLTVYLLKKIFLENKTLNEINKDLDTDLNPVFHNENKNYMTYGCLNSLGIKLPKHEYLTSLYHTKEGYSDYVGKRISEGQARFWDSLTEEQRMERKKSSLRNLENWWNNLSNEDKLALLEKQDSEIRLLKEYKKSQKSASKPLKTGIKTPETKEDAENKSKKRPKSADEKLETSLSNDEIFLEWARKNLEIFELNLSDEQKAELNQKRSEAQLSRWQDLSDEEKTALIEKMQTGSFNQKIAMIGAWNNCSDIREHLSDFMKENKLHGADGLIYRDLDFSESQKKIMIAFWKKYPDDAIKLGDEIKNSYDSIKNSIKDGTFDELKTEILDERAKIKKAKKQGKKRKAENPKNNDVVLKTPLERAREEFTQQYHGMYYFMPKEFLDFYCNYTLENLKDARALDIWSRIVTDDISPNEMEYLTSKIVNIKDSPEMFLRKRAAEQAIAEVLYEASDKSQEALNLFGLRFKNLQTMMLATEAHVIFPIRVDNEKMSVTITKRPDSAKLERLYEKYREPLDAKSAQYITQFCLGAVNSVDKRYNVTDPSVANKVRASFREFLKMYGSSISCIMADSDCPGRQQAFNKFSQLFFEQNIFKQNQV